MSTVAVTSSEETVRNSPNTTGTPSLWQRFSFALMQHVLWGLARVFSLGGLYRIGQAFGFLEWLVNYKRRGRYRKGLEAFLGNRLTRKRCTAETIRFFMRFRCDKIFYLIFDRIPHDKAMTCLQIRNAELVDRAVEQGKGCLVCLSHFGAHHVIGMLLSLHGYKVAAIRDPNEGAMRRYVQQRHDEKHPELRRMKIVFGGGFAREIYRCLEENYTIGAALDSYRIRDPNIKTMQVRLLDRTADCVSGPIRIALRLGSAVIQGFIVSEKNFRYRMDFLGPLVEQGTPDSETVLESAIATYAANVERYVLEYPHHISRAG